MTVTLSLWLWWDERNKWRDEGKRRSVAEIAYVTAALTDRYTEEAWAIVGFSSGSALEATTAERA
jgi:hypothetical protein